MSTGIYGISRDWGDQVTVVRILTHDTLATVATTGYLTAQLPNILAVNHGEFTFLATDSVLVSASDGNAIFALSSDFSTLILSGDGSVTSITAGSGLLGGTITTSGTISLNITNIQNDAYSYVTDTGTANTYVATLSPALISYVAGLVVNLKISHANTGASTLNVNGLGAKAITSTAIAALTSGEIGAGMIANFVYDGTQFQLLNPIASSGVAADDVQNQAFNYSLDTGSTTNVYVATLSPAVTSYVAGLFVLLNVASGNGNNGPSTLNVNGLGAIAVTKIDATIPGQIALVGGEIAEGFSLFYYDGTEFQLINFAGSWNFDGAGNPNLVNPASSGQGYTLYLGNNGTICNADSSMAIGNNCVTNDAYAFALGWNCSANGLATFALGKGSTANSSGSFVFSDSTGSTNADTGGDQFVLNFAGGFHYNQGSGVSLFRINEFSGIGLGYQASPTNGGSVVILDGSNNGITDDTTNEFVASFEGGLKFYSGTVLGIWQDANSNFITKLGQADQSYSLQVPTDAFTVSIDAGVTRLILNPAGTLSSGEIVMPPSAIDGQLCIISTTQIVGTLTINGNGATVMNAPASLAAGQAFAFIYNLQSTTWFPTV